MAHIILNSNGPIATIEILSAYELKNISSKDAGATSISRTKRHQIKYKGHPIWARSLSQIIL